MKSNDSLHRRIDIKSTNTKSSSTEWTSANADGKPEKTV